MAKLRAINKDEKEIIDTLIERKKLRRRKGFATARVAYASQGNFTTAVVLVGTHVLAGAAKFNPFDGKKGIAQFSPEAGQKVAFHRALQQLNT
jgi:hypothetical protein